MSDFSNNLKRLRKAKQLGQDALAQEVNKKYGTKFSKGMISKWENGKEATIQSAGVLAQYFGVTLDEMIGLKIAESSSTYAPKELLPIVGTISAGTPIFAEQNIIGYAPAPPFIQAGDNTFYLKVQGNSMNHIIEEGSFVVIDRDKQVENGEIAAVMVNGNEAGVKKVYIKNNLLTLIPMSTDNRHQPETYDLEKEEVTFIGKVVGSFKEL